MNRFISHIIDFIFPPSNEELQLREISSEEFLKTAPKANPTEFPFIFSLFSYKDSLVKELIWQIKYKKNKRALEIAGYALYEYIKQKYDQVLLIPIPISNKRKKERGYNQTELIIDEIIKLDKNNRISKNYEILKRKKNIDKQTFKNRNERIENTKEIFDVLDSNIDLDKNQKIIIIDDVTTTGSTLREAREVLLKAGFVDVIALTVAH